MIRTGSIALQSPAVFSLPRVSLARNDSLLSVFSYERSTVESPMISLHFYVNRRRDKTIRRALLESDILRSTLDEFRALPASYARKLAGSGISTEELVPGGGDRGGNTVTVEEDEQRKIGAYYQGMLKSNPGDQLLLRNYGKFLHEVEKDAVGAEECYCRAILGSPGDGELLSLYAKLIWETQNVLRTKMEELLYSYGVDIVFSGHVHAYNETAWKLAFQKAQCSLQRQAVRRCPPTSEKDKTFIMKGSACSLPIF